MRLLLILLVACVFVTPCNGMEPKLVALEAIHRLARAHLLVLPPDIITDPDIPMWVAVAMAIAKLPPWQREIRSIASTASNSLEAALKAVSACLARGPSAAVFGMYNKQYNTQSCSHKDFCTGIKLRWPCRSLQAGIVEFLKSLPPFVRGPSRLPLATYLYALALAKHLRTCGVRHIQGAYWHRQIVRCVTLRFQWDPDLLVTDLEPIFPDKNGVFKAVCAQLGDDCTVAKMGAVYHLGGLRGGLLVSLFACLFKGLRLADLTLPALHHLHGRLALFRKSTGGLDSASPSVYCLWLKQLFCDTYKKRYLNCDLRGFWLGAHRSHFQHPSPPGRLLVDDLQHRLQAHQLPRKLGTPPGKIRRCAAPACLMRRFLLK